MAVLPSIRKNLDAGGQLTDYKLANDNVFMNASWNDKLGEKWRSAQPLRSPTTKTIFISTKLMWSKRSGKLLKSTLSYSVQRKVILKFGGELFAKTFSQDAQIGSEIHNNSFTNHTFSGFTEAQVYASSKFVTVLAHVLNTPIT